MSTEKKTTSLVEKWYVIHTYSGHEYKVRDALEERIISLGFKDTILEILVPDEEKIEVKNGKRKIVQKKCFPGYVLAKIKVEPIKAKSGQEYKMSNESWYVIKNTDGVTGFIGSGGFPIPIEEADVENIKKRMKRYTDKPKIESKFKIGDRVEIINGSFMGSFGKISSVDNKRMKLVVMVDIFNRLTPVEVGFEEVSFL
jgi:transcriptional antiterminator NusG